MDEIRDYKLLLDTAVKAGELMLLNGAEIYRVEDTINRILAMSGLKTREAYVTTTGMIVTLDDPKVDSMTVVKRIRERDVNLNRITIVNTVSRSFCGGEITLNEAFRRLKHMEGDLYTRLQKDVCIVVVVLAFALLLGGTAWDALGAGLDGILLVLVNRLGSRIGLNLFTQTLVSTSAIAFGAAALTRIPGVGMDMDMIIIGALMPLLPGAAVTTAVRDTLQGDYVAGGAKAVEALVKVMAMVIGVGFAFSLTGGAAA